MGWQDREYSQPWEQWERRSGGGSDSKIPRPPKIVVVLMIVHAAAWLLMLMLAGDASTATLPKRFALSGASADALGVLLHPYASSKPLSVLIDALVFWTLGTAVANRCGPGRVIAWYLLGNFAAGVVYFGIARIAPALGVLPLESPIGAFGAWLAAFWWLHRDEPMLVLGKYRHAGTLLLGVYGAVVLLMLLFYRGDVVALLCASFGGMAAAPLASAALTSWPQGGLQRRVRRPSAAGGLLRPRVRALAEHGAAAPQAAVSASPLASEPAPPDIDDLLVKISREGIHSLTADERGRLEAARQAKLRERRPG